MSLNYETKSNLIPQPAMSEIVSILSFFNGGFGIK